MANTLMSLLVSIGVDSADFQKGITGAEKDVTSFSKKMGDVGKSMTKLGTSMTVGLTLPIVAFGASAVQSAQDAESAVADLNAVLESTGGAAGVTLDELTGMASELQKVTKFSDEAVMSAQGMLLTFTNIGKDVFPDATMAALDMAEKFGMDASQAAVTLGKALNDPIAGVGALRRIGVQLTDAQEEQVKSFMAVGDVASAQKIIMNELAVEIGGVATAAGATSSGQMAQFTNQLDDMKEIVGNALIPSLIRLMEAVTPLIVKFSEASPATQNTIIAFAAIVAAAGPVITTIGGIVSAVGALTPVITGLFTFISATAIPAIGAFVIANAAWIVPLLLVAATVYLVYQAFKTNFGGITTTVQQLGFLIKYAFDGIVNQIKGAIDWVVKLASTFLKIKLPSALTPGSPTPFEMGLRGINNAMGALTTKSLPDMQAGLNLIPNVSGIGGQAGAGSSGAGGGKNISVTINNPKGETSEDSLRKELKSLSYLGVVD